MCKYGTLSFTNHEVQITLLIKGCIIFAPSTINEMIEENALSMRIISNSNAIEKWLRHLKNNINELFKPTVSIMILEKLILTMIDWFLLKSISSRDQVTPKNLLTCKVVTWDMPIITSPRLSLIPKNTPHNIRFHYESSTFYLINVADKNRWKNYVLWCLKKKIFLKFQFPYLFCIVDFLELHIEVNYLLKKDWL